MSAFEQPVPVEESDAASGGPGRHGTATTSEYSAETMNNVDPSTPSVTGPRAALSQARRKVRSLVARTLHRTGTEVHPEVKSDTVELQDTANGQNETGLAVAPTTTPSFRSAPLTLETLPPELLFQVLRHLDFPSVLSLRRTSRQFHEICSKKQVQRAWGTKRYRSVLAKYCKVCMRHIANPKQRLDNSKTDKGYPLSSSCISCARMSKTSVIRYGKKIRMGDRTDCYVCRWCGWPITASSSVQHAHFHPECWRKYGRVMTAFVSLGWIQFFLNLVTSVIAWRFYRIDSLVFPPSLVNFGLSWVCLCFVIMRGNLRRTYWTTFMLELSMLTLWIPPVYFIANRIAAGEASRIDLGFLALCVTIMLFRLMNVIGNLILALEYDRTKHYIPNIPMWKRAWSPLGSLFLFWTYPSALERRDKAILRQVPGGQAGNQQINNNVV